MEKERVKEIPGTDGRYKVSDMGNVYGPSGRKKLVQLDKWGYQTVSIHYPGKRRKKYFVHRLVLSAFSPCDNMDMLQVNHKDENKQNNRLNNLEWCTNAYNQAYGTKQERLSDYRSKAIEALDMSGKIVGRYKSATEAARMLGLTQSNIWAAVNGKRDKAYGLRWRRTPMGV